MTLNPKLQPLLDLYNTLPTPAWTTAAQRRKAVQDSAFTEHYAALITPPPALAEVWEERIAINEPDDEMTVRIYRPELTEPTAGALLHLHGGGWWSGSPDDVDTRCRHLATGAGIVVVSVGYRLAPEHRFPIPLHDAFTALHWMVQHARRLRIDPQRIGVGGESAGGNLAAALAILTRDQSGPPLRLQLLEVPALDLTLSSDSVRAFGDGYFLTATDLAWCVEQYLGDQDAINPLASPLHVASLDGLPPAVITTAQYDPLADDGSRYADRLREAGIPCSFVCYPGMVHSSHHLTALLPTAVQWRNDVVAAVRHHLSGRQ
ncbi:alpha/beta hydrolase [Streptacidiphilus fuscans]|uniref:Alpha/beta hydrolase n=1 Tax=Streptacidiphilus fuscans TaxID=2789292 RepID=A0A931B0X7_9ACTN|nr:alpha/beta hydrolase [Streptacidiphilus fuscans]MBF9069059.1 alpha/beta hydrolase [Streptacidiphilus fuscans]